MLRSIAFQTPIPSTQRPLLDSARKSPPCKALPYVTNRFEGNRLKTIHAILSSVEKHLIR